jgi:hypothetical protein
LLNLEQLWSQSILCEIFFIYCVYFQVCIIK